jgi:hypothetical protein
MINGKRVAVRPRRHQVWIRSDPDTIGCALAKWEWERFSPFRPARVKAGVAAHPRAARLGAPA